MSSEDRRFLGRDALSRLMGRDLDASEVEIAVSRPGRVVLDAEASRCTALRAGAVPPAACGPDMPAAIARGTIEAFTPMRMVRGSSERQVPDGWLGRDAARARDVFDRIGDGLTHGQIAMAREYREMTERHAAGSLRCSSLEAGRAGGGDAGGFIDAFLDVGARLRGLHRRIGDGVALEVRRVRPSDRGARRAVRDRVLVDMVCLGDRTLDAVLGAHGWAVKGDARAALRVALAAALDRMQGYGQGFGAN